MGRMYSVVVDASGVAAAVDVFEVVAASGKPFILHEIVLGQSSDYGDSAAEGLGLQIKRSSGTFGSGSGGTSATPARHTSNDAAAGATAEVCNTTAASGTFTVLRAEAWNVQAGWQYLPTPEQRYTFLPGEACILSMTAPADALTLSATLVFEEW